MKFFRQLELLENFKLPDKRGFEPMEKKKRKKGFLPPDPSPFIN